jgi:hypothetical protein
VRTAVAVLTVFLVLTGCSSSDDDADVAPTSTTAEAGVSSPGGNTSGGEEQQPQASPAAALEQLLVAEQRGDHDAAYAFVAHGPDQPFHTVNQWARRRRELPPITEYTVEEQDDPEASSATATVGHEPKLDPFSGLVPARERQTWSAQRVGDGYVLAQEPDIVPILPSDDDALDAARAWAEDVQRCDEAAATARQAVTTLFGSTAQSGGLCGSSGAVEVGDAGPLPAGPLSGDIVAQYSADALEWARVVTLSAPVRLLIVLAPIGDTWKVLGIGDVSP